MNGEAQTLSVTFTRDLKLFRELIAFAHARAYPRFALMLSCLIVVPIVAITGLIFRDVVGSEDSFERLHIGLIMGASAALLLYIFIQSRLTYLGKFVQDGGWFLQTATVTVSSDKLQLEQTGMTCLYDWNQILEIYDRPDSLIFLTDKADGLIIPKSAFASEAHLAGFLAASHSFIQNK